ncbi:MAG TPA: class I SAM-dependent rRNA methyltransferase [Bacteroidales bacterium]|nr:class I SAM-dependent rRNA methyltransferase [Bacteroidales bacterium]HOX74700.1 class I SAM-dependent rRNA methyltransferase [Bacteroidales bacterium]HPM87866.1 class I SAM-dependent rRNA methyltransferase [Bacteroidales bacterium]HQM70062.1 class I SAM-dependent rRNA methyltransferase [Bacteroidales bacterium]
MQRVKIILKSGKDQSVRRFHPWIFSGAIKKIYGSPSEGDLVNVYDNKENFLAAGHYQPGSIAVRILTFRELEPDIEFFRKRIKSAIDFRKSTGLTFNGETNVFRLVHAEGDDLPGLIIDYYNGIAVMQFHSVGMYRLRQDFAEILKDLCGDNLTAVYDKSAETIPHMSGVKPVNEYLSGNHGPAEVTENGFKFRIDWSTGQKTGFYIDQRENRQLVGKYSKGKCVLNMFGYTGGFSVYAMRNAESVHTVDSSGPAIDMANENIRLNFGDDKRHESFRTDAFSFLENIKDKYDLIILDPPAFAKHNNVLANALQGYKRLNIKAIEQIRPGGIIFTFSCSQVVSKENFRKSVFAAAANTGRRVRILHQLSQPPDHPVNIYHPESEYLKGLVLYVE